MTVAGVPSHRGGDGGGREGEAIGFRFLELSYGCHAARFELPARGRPFVILGPNGAGKSTLVEALVRTVYGFNRRLEEDRRVLEERRPWAAEAFRGRVGLAGPEGAVTIERDFETDEVVVLGKEEGRPLFRGSANPAASGSEIRRYRELLARHLGLAELDDYERTACVHQGSLPGTRLGEDLLRLAAGGHAHVEAARERIRKEYHDLTLEPIAPGEGRRRAAGEVERARDRVRELEERHADARAAEERREPLVRRRKELGARVAALEGDIRVLEEGLGDVARAERVSAQLEASRGRLEELEESRRELDEALARVELMGPGGPEGRGVEDPPDFLERAAALEELWPRERELEAGRSRHREGLARDDGSAGHAAIALAVGLALMAGGVLLAGLGAPPAAGALAGIAGMAVAGWGLARRRRRKTRRERDVAALSLVEAELAEVRARIRAKLEGVPDGEALGPATLAGRRRTFIERRERRAHRQRVRDRLRAEMDDAERVLRRSRRAVAPDGEEEGKSEEVPREETLERRTRDLLARLDGAGAEERNDRMAPLALELREASRTRVSLPDGVPPEGPAVRRGLAERRQERDRLREELAGLERRLAHEARTAESSAVIADRVRDERRALEELRRKATAYRHAFTLLTDAYEEFRRTDQDRLLEEVSRHLRRATDGGLGPVEAEEGLETARVRQGGRALPLESPPLSYGQLHSVLFAVRIGAADFLAGLGVRVPLLVDDPFVHLDEGRAAQLWEVLCGIAEDRQVVVATQDRLLLGHLGVEADLELAAPAGEAGEGADAGEGAERRDGGEGRGAVDAAVLDLWGTG